MQANKPGPKPPATGASNSTAPRGSYEDFPLGTPAVVSPTSSQSPDLRRAWQADVLAPSAAAGYRRMSLPPSHPTADADGGAEPPCGSLTVINRMISSRSAADGRPIP